MPTRRSVFSRRPTPTSGPFWRLFPISGTARSCTATSPTCRVRRAAWAAWNHVSRRGDDRAAGGVTYWMNRLQSLPGESLFVTLNPLREPNPSLVLGDFEYEHPVFTAASLAAQQDLWSLQGRQSTWFCGAWFGSGFHEDGLQAGLAVAEQLGGVRRPWTVADESGRIVLPPRGKVAIAA